MRILMLAGQFYPDVAGSAVATQNIAMDLTLRGHDVTVIVDLANKPVLDQKNLPFKIEYAESYKAFMVGNAGFKKATEDIYGVINKGQFDIVHVYSYLPMLILSLLRHTIRVPVVFTFWSTPYRLERSIGFYNESVLDMQLSSTIIKMQKYDRMILGSQSSYNSAIGQGADKGITDMFYHGIDLEEFDDFLRKSASINLNHYINGLHKSDRLIMLPGRITPRKGIYEAVLAFKIVNRAYPSKLLLTGMVDPYDEKFAASILRLAKQVNILERIIVPKKVIYRESMAAFYKRADIVITPSYSEGLGFTAIEALRAARPLVATDVPGLNEILEDGKNSLLVIPQDSESLAAGIIRVIENPELAKHISSSGPDSVKKFDIKEFVSKLLKTYTYLVAEQKEAHGSC